MNKTCRRAERHQTVSFVDVRCPVGSKGLALVIEMSEVILQVVA